MTAHRRGRPACEQIQFTLDVGAVFDVETVDNLAGFAGLGSHQRVAEHFCCMRFDFVQRKCEADTALGICIQFLKLALAAATCVDLRFDDPKRARQAFGSGFCFIGRKDRNALGHRCTEFLQYGLGLVFMNVHVFPPLSEDRPNTGRPLKLVGRR